MAKKTAETPLMAQYYEMKGKHPDAILLFRVGDFYETFSEDAIETSRILGITLTRRGNGSATSVELAGFPHHALDSYLPKLVRAGKRVAICEQLEDPKLTKKLVKRGITELVTPGVNPSDTTLSSRENNFLGAVHFSRPLKNADPVVGLALLDITTGEFLCEEGSPDYIDKLIGNIAPREIVRMRGTSDTYKQYIHAKCALSELEDWVFTPETATDRLLTHFKTTSLKGYGVDGMPAAIIAAGAILHYLDYTQHHHLAHISTLRRLDGTRYVRLDPFTIRNLELTASTTIDGKSLFDVLDMTRTPMGKRLLTRWILFPLLNLDEIKRRHDTVEHFFRAPSTRHAVAAAIEPIGDLARIASRTATRRANCRELLALRDALHSARQLRATLLEAECDTLADYGRRMPDCQQVIEDISRTILPDTALTPSKGLVIAPGVSAELDHAVSLASGGKSALDGILQREIERTGITSLKIAYNNVFGYYIEVRNTHRDKVPTEWIRKQTLVNAERYITPELKTLEEDILNAQTRMLALQEALLAQLFDRLSAHAPEIIRSCEMIAEVDCLLSFADVAEKYRYVRPEVDDSYVLDIRDGRHPVIERSLPPGEEYVANNVTLDSEDAQIIMLTGPNMAGKSALLRQTALIALMAQIGSFVPATSARVGLVDKIFTRVGASDNISQGESTFMVEMNEAASILNNMSPRSIILFDELGRGTSTYDGISIAWAIVEYIHENGYARPKTLFATHYHELNEMEKTFPRVRNYNVAVREINGKVVFIRKLERGGSEHSFGIHVAKLAGMPEGIVKRADKVLASLEAQAAAVGGDGKDTAGGRGKKGVKSQKPDLSGAAPISGDGSQLSLFQLDDPLLSQIRDALLNLNIDNLTPMQALNKLHDLQSLITG